MTVNWLSADNIATLVCLAISIVLLVYNGTIEMKKVNDDKTHSFIYRMQHLTPNAKISLIYFILVIIYYICSLGRDALADSATSCLIWQFGADIFTLPRTGLLLAYYAMRLRAVFIKQKWSIYVPIVLVYVIQVVLLVALMMMRDATISDPDEMVSRVCTIKYNSPTWITLAYLSTIIFPILISNILFTYKVLNVMKHLPNDMNSISYLKKTSGGIDLLNMIMALFSIISSGLSTVPGAAQVSNLLLTFIFHFALAGKRNGDAASSAAQSVIHHPTNGRSMSVASSQA